MGRSELNACEGFLRQAMLHLLKMRLWPDNRDSNHLREEASEFLTSARKKWTPSMRQRLDLNEIYSDAVRNFVNGGGERSAVPASCPFLLGDLLARDADLTKLLTWPTPPEDPPC